ncbi:NAD(P)-dependent oxidoreductase [Pseudonocardia dioxanivorans]|jgi:3-hydroxyisobutyrate dehydrogenase-like beta-hydroxyacid dehydrogenase|uniref:NAD(P)-dependent oxidoreductase n=1 Tax=Pseudonocardia dioxanivorans TaxID=240495 RepID=UPI000CD0B91A|nr:NAD(P)-dependent oxidoreductase [Pseudonocardia dioxanivorans]
MTIQTVGVLGLGAMGRPMGRHLASAGFGVVGYDPDHESVRQAEQVGVRALGSPKEVAHATDIVLVVVGFEAQVESVIFGDDGVLSGARPGLILGLGSTVSPSYARELAERLDGSGIELLDMPLTRSDRAAEDGTMLVLAGAAPGVVDTCRPVLDTFATDIFDLGPFGSGQVAKMVNNMILWACVAANDEGLRFGESLGLDPDRLREALVVSSAANFALIERADERPLPWAEKDMIIAQYEADRLRFPMPVGGLVKEIVKAFKVRKGYPTPSL